MNAIDQTTVTRSGYLVYFTTDGATYSFSTLCNCPAVTFEAQAVDGADYMNVTYTCAAHGTHTSAALRCAETPHSKPSAVFARSEQRHARDRRVSWGMKQ